MKLQADTVMGLAQWRLVPLTRLCSAPTQQTALQAITSVNYMQ